MRRYVVNCFCSLNFIYLSQQGKWGCCYSYCCELLLFFEFHIFVTAVFKTCCRRKWLWIAFVLWISYICHSISLLIFLKLSVVNCFCSLNFIYLSQLTIMSEYPILRCELLLFFEFHIFVTANETVYRRPGLLWIAFVLWISYICHS